jgi:NCS1 family nucleobase:cation symporter-1
VEDPTGYIFRWLVAYSALLGAVGGILIADYFVIRRTRLDLTGLYKKDGPYWYVAGFNPVALIALVLGIAPCVPGFLAAVSESWKTYLAPADPDAFSWTHLYPYAWFISFGISFVVYAVLMKAAKPGFGSPVRS